MIKRCARCRVLLPSEQFHKNRDSRDGLQTYCKVCQRGYDKARYDRKSSGEKCRWYKFRRDYGLTKDTYHAMLAMQGYECRICHTTITEAGTGPRSSWACVDHDHTTGRVRGLLCRGCNVGLGNFRDRPDLLQRAIAYLGVLS
jgi:Recombination endonuclease VII